MDQELSPSQDLENKIKKLALKYEKGAFSYLYWPCTTNLSSERLHVTAKFFGDTPFTIEEIRESLEAVEGFDQQVNVAEIEWEPVIFETKNDGLVQVLELTKYPAFMKQVHDCLSKYRRDDYGDYRPHITVAKEVWEHVLNNKITPQQADLRVMPLELTMQGLTRFKWGPEEGYVEEIEGVDVHTNNPTMESTATRVIEMINSVKY